MKSQLFLLKTSVKMHSFFTLSSILFVVFTSLDIKFKLVEYGAIATFLSFFVLGRCVMVDFYDLLKPEGELPHSAQDNYTRDNIKKLVNKFLKKKKQEVSPEKAKEIEKTRLDIVSNIEPFLGETDPVVLNDIHNRKFQYILGNIIIGMCIGQRYAIPMSIPLMLWVVFTFPF